MCGIVGFSGSPELNVLRRMNASQIYRGPDDEGYYECERDGVSLAMRRLSIQDLAGGHQPMSSPDGRFIIVFNGEIFNAPELRVELAKQGYPFRTEHSDTEVILGMYVTYGEAMVSRLNGMFAFVIHDKAHRILFGARDRFGIKPFYYSLKGERFSFASELKSLLELPWVSKEIDIQAAFHFFSFQSIPSPFSIFRDIRKLPPACAFHYSLESKKFETREYWRPKFGEGCPVPEEEIPSYIRQELTAAVRRWSLSDVPVACSLSGGIDSASIVAIFAELNSGKKLKTYSLGFKDAPELDELPLARMVAQKYATEHHEIRIESKDLLHDLGKMVTHLDEPYAGGLPSWFVFKRMSEDVKVGLTGSGGDEIFGNYGKWIPYESWKERARFIVRARREGLSFSDVLRHPRASTYPLYYRDEFKRRDLFSPERTVGLESSEQLIEKIWDNSGIKEARDRIPALDVSIQLPEEFLHMTDRFSMAHSLEARTPFLDHEFAEKMFAIPSSIRTSRSAIKGTLIRAVSPLLPPALVTSPKRGFVIPMREWTRGELRTVVEEFLSTKYLERQGLFKPSIYETLVRPHLLGVRDSTSKVWTLLMFQLWYRRFIEGSETEVLI